MAEIDQRARKILQAIVQEYLHTGDAVGSRTITRRRGIDLSPATVRNVMSDLAELGLLKQPHASAGRIPTSDGLRFFVNSLLKVRRLSRKEREEIRARFGLPSADMEEAMQRASRILSELSQQASIIITPAPDKLQLKHIEFLRLRDGELLVVLVSSGDQVVNKLLHIEVPTDSSFLGRVNNYLNDLLAGKTLEEVRAKVAEELTKEKSQLGELEAQALRMSEAALPALEGPDIIVTGQAHLLDESVGGGAGKMDEMRALLQALEEKEQIVRILDSTLSADGIQVWLGADTPFSEMGDLSVVAKPYGPEDTPVGSIAVIGPTRMNYSKVIPLVDFTAEIVSELFGDQD